MRRSKEEEAFAVFQAELDHCENPIHIRDILYQTGTEYRELKKWNQSVEYLEKSCLELDVPEEEIRQSLCMINEAIAQTYLEQYCSDINLDIKQRTDQLNLATAYTMYAQSVDEETPGMHLIRSQLFYFNGDKHRAYEQLKLYLDARLIDFKLKCYTCEQRIRHGSISLPVANAAG